MRIKLIKWKWDMVIVEVEGCIYRGNGLAINKVNKGFKETWKSSKHIDIIKS